MRPFHTVAIPHRDILEGRLTMDIFAADLWEVFQNRGPDEYKDAETFFRKTFLTQGLENLLTIVEKRLRGEGGDPVIQIQTPFGGGKTHALIAMYHKAEEWNAKKVVVVGTALDAQSTIWSILEEQLTGKTERLSGREAPGKETLRKVLHENQPILILMDEILQYATRAAGVKVEDSTLAAQTTAFIQELTEVAGTLEKVCLTVTLPSSIIEHYDETAEKLFQQLQKVAGRVEKIYTPVQESEITKVIRRRLFSDIKQDQAKEVVTRFVEYAEQEGILPADTTPTEYRDRFLDSYPFMPEVVNVLYHRWGSFPTFQRTRGVLRLLSLVIHSLKESDKPFISLADFDLAHQEIRRELLKHIGSECDSVIAADITDEEAGSKKVDIALGKAYRGLKLGSRTATAIFLYSFSGGDERGATPSEIKRCATTIENPASAVAEASEQLKSKLFYLQSIGEKYFFSTQPNLNRILLTRMENIKEGEVFDLEHELLVKSIKGGKLRVFLWPGKAGDLYAADIPDSEELKLIVLRQKDEEVMRDILETKGKTPRVYRNTLFFLLPLESERPGFLNALRRKIAYQHIEGDKTLNLSDDQKREVKKELKKEADGLKESIRRFYRIVAAPTKAGFKEIDLGIPTYGEEKGLDQEVYEKLRSEGEILEKIVPVVIKEKYLSGKDYVLTEQLYQSSLKTPGETRLTDRAVLEGGIAEGVSMGLFGLGELRDEKPVCRYFKQQASVALSGGEVLISEDVCKEQLSAHETEPAGAAYTQQSDMEGEKICEKLGFSGQLGSQVIEVPPVSREETGGGTSRNELKLKFQVPRGKVSSVMGMMNLLQSKFETLQIELICSDGTISEQDYEDKIKETFRQLGIEWEE